MLLDLLFPNRCLHCTRMIEAHEWICSACWDQVALAHYDFNGTNDFAKRCRVHFPIENAYALFEFVKSSPVQTAIHQLKYKHREIIGRFFAELFISKLSELPSEIDLITYIPIHEKKRRDRGYNQLTQFCTIIGNHFKIPVEHNALIRKIHRKAQAQKSKEERYITQNIFECTQPYHGTHFLLIDDVYTTGNTIASAAWQLLKSGEGNKISVLVMAEDK